MARFPSGLLRGRALAWGLAGLMAALAVVFAVLWRMEGAEDRRRAEIEASAAAFLRALTNFSAETIEGDVDRIRTFAVGRFADELQDTFSAERIRAIREQQAVSTGRIESLFVQEIEDDTAVLFAVVTETVDNAETEAPRRDTLRIELEMIETSDAWKVERLTLLQTPETAPAP